MTDQEQAQLGLEERKLALEEKRASNDFWKFIWGSVVAGIVIATIPPSFQFATAYLEGVRRDNQLILEQQNRAAERDAKQQEFRNTYIQQFLTTALAQDVELRTRFAEYFANVSPEEYQQGWMTYRDSVRGDRNKIRDSIDSMEADLEALQSQTAKANSPEARKIIRRLNWAYAELGYVSPDRSVAVNPRASLATQTRPDVSTENERLFQRSSIDVAKKPIVEEIVKRIVANKARYEAVEATSRVPWHVVAMLHYLETNLSFSAHLHNGDPLTARTKNVPAGRPTSGAPPFTWEASATDALASLVPVSERASLTSAANVLTAFERYNGFGYRTRGVASPYLWACTDQYTKGKFVSDGHYDPDAIVERCGAAAILKSLVDQNLVTLRSSVRRRIAGIPESQVEQASAMAIFGGARAISKERQPDGTFTIVVEE